jgi:hypothetical protein
VELPLPALRIAEDDSLVPHPASMTRALAAKQVDVIHRDLVRGARGSRLLSMDPPWGQITRASRITGVAAV